MSRGTGLVQLGPTGALRGRRAGGAPCRVDEGLLRVDHSHVHVVRSDDHGRSWQAIARLPYYSGAPLRGCTTASLYMFVFSNLVRKSETDNLLIVRSDDGGKTLDEGHHPV